MPEFQVRRGGAWVSVGGDGGVQPVPDVTDLDPIDVGNVLGLAGYLAAMEDVYSESVPYGQKVGQSHAPLTTPGAGTLVTVQRSLGPQDIAWFYTAGGYSSMITDGYHERTFRVNLRALLAGASPVWEEKALAPTKRGYGIGGVVAGKLTHGGGTKTNPIVNHVSVEEYDPTTDVWTTKTALNTGRRSGAQVTLDDHLAMIGGYNGSSGRDGHYARVYPINNTNFNSVMTGWTPLVASQGVLGSGACWLNGWFYVLGGVEASRIATFRRWAFGSGHEVLPVYPEAVENPAVSTDGNSIFAFGGYDGSHMNDVRKYTPGGVGWVDLTPLPAATYMAQSFWFAEAGVFIVFGGVSADKQNDRVWAYDPSADTWDELGVMPITNRGSAYGLIELAAV